MEKTTTLVDIGNSKVKFAPKGCITEKVESISMKEWLQHPEIPESDVYIVSSVVPRALSVFEERVGKNRTLLAGRDVLIPLKNRTKVPQNVGTDRLLASFAAYDEAKKDLIVMSCGTTFVINIVSNGIFVGGNIIPGPALMAKSLALGTAKVDIGTFEFASPDLPPLGLDTKGAVEKGISRAIQSVAESLIAEYRTFLDNPVVYASGGWSKWLAETINHRILLRENLVLHGLDLLPLRV